MFAFYLVSDGVHVSVRVCVCVLVLTYHVVMEKPHGCLFTKHLPLVCIHVIQPGRCFFLYVHMFLELIHLC